MTSHLAERRWTTTFQSWLILGLMASLAGFIGWILGGAEGILWALAAGGFLACLSPRISSSVLLRAQGARELHPSAAPGLYAMFGELSDRAGLRSRPRLYWVPAPALNALSVGIGDNAAVAVSAGLVRRLSDRELRGVLAHELSHIKKRDTRLLTFAEVFRRVTRALSLFGLLLLFLALPAFLQNGGLVPLFAPIVLIGAPVLSALLQLALSRTREFAADLEAVRLTRDPTALASALRKIEAAQGGLLWRVLFPSLEKVPILKWLRTHPETEERIRRLLELREREMEGQRKEQAFERTVPRRIGTVYPGRAADPLERVLEQMFRDLARERGRGRVVVPRYRIWS